MGPGVRHPEVSRDREELDQRWRNQIADVVRGGQQSGEFDAVDASAFALLFSALLDGLVVQVALGDPTVTQQVRDRHLDAARRPRARLQLAKPSCFQPA